MPNSWWQRRLNLVVGEAPAASFCSGARRPNTRIRYGPWKNAIRRSGDSPAHPDADSMLDDDDGDQSWTEPEEIRPSSAKGNNLPAVSEDILIQFLLTWCINHRGGAPGLLHGRRAGFNRWRGFNTGARVSGSERGTREEEEIGRWRRTPRVPCGGGRRYIGRQGRWCGSWRRWLAEARQRAASSEWRKTMDPHWWVPPVDRIPKRYPGQAPGGLTSWAGQVGCGQVSSFPLFSVLFSLFLFYFCFRF
jgi:hypothetical protein